MKVVLDANIVVSFLLTGGETISSVFDYWEKGIFTVLISAEIILEINQVLDRLILEGEIDSFAAESLMRKLQEKGKKIKVVSKFDISKDKKDNRYLECAKDGKADYLVSGNEHLLELGKFKYTKILSPREFVELLRNLNYTF